MAARADIGRRRTESASTCTSHLPTRTVVKVLLTLIVVWAGLRLWPQFVLLLISLLLAVALHPVVTSLERRGLGRGAVVGLMTLAMCAVAAVLITVVFTSLAEQLSKLVQDFPALRDRVDQRLPAHYPTLKRVVREIFALPSSPEVAAQLKRPLALGTVALSGDGVDLLHDHRDDLPAARRQAPVRVAHRLHPARAPRAHGGHRRRGLPGRLRVRARAGDLLAAVHRVLRHRAVGAGRAGGRSARASWPGLCDVIPVVGVDPGDGAGGAAGADRVADDRGDRARLLRRLSRRRELLHRAAHLRHSGCACRRWPSCWRCWWAPRCRA